MSCNYRKDAEKINGLFVLIDDDLFKSSDPDAASRVLENLMNQDNIHKYISDLKKRLKANERNKGDPKKMLKNYKFVGPPGTGKTTVARAFGEIFHMLGMLSNSAVVECKAMELIGEYVGQSGGKVR